jgi:hypothetical protein
MPLPLIAIRLRFGELSCVLKILHNKGFQMSPLNSCNHNKPAGWDDHLEDFKTWATTTDQIHKIIGEMHTDTKYLSSLPIIVNELKAMRESYKSLIGPATGANRVPVGMVMAVIGSMSFCTLILGALLLVNMSDDRSISLNPAGISVGATEHGR